MGNYGLLGSKQREEFLEAVVGAEYTTSTQDAHQEFLEESSPTSIEAPLNSSSMERAPSIYTKTRQIIFSFTIQYLPPHQVPSMGFSSCSALVSQNDYVMCQ
jgi:hypothetical protein